MNRRIQLTRLTGSSLLLLIAGYFSHQFSRFQLTGFVNLGGYRVHDLPAVCLFFARFSVFALLLSPLVFGFGVWLLSRQESPSARVECVSVAAVLLAMLLVAGCLLAWQLPYLAPVVELS
jgi:ABC-type multidrug transport system permease subunit